MKWSQLKKRINERLSESVRNRIDFGSTSYRKSHDQEGRGWIAIDKHEILNMASIKFDIELYRMGREAGYAVLTKELQDNNLFAQGHWHRSLFDYLNLSIDEILQSENPLIRAIGMLDARVGKRRLKKINVSNEHALVKRLYALRCDSESIPFKGERDLTARIEYLLARSEMEDDPVESQKNAVAKLAHSKKTRKIPHLIAAIYHSEITEEELDTPVSRELFAGFEQTENPDALLQTLLFVEAKTKLLKEVPFTRGVIALTRDMNQWLRPIQDWSPSSHNPGRQFSSLARHLWATYDVPLFMDNAWLQGDALQQQWFRHIGAGNNIRNAASLPLPLTRKMAHFFLGAPDAYSIEAAFRWGQVHALGGDERLVTALLDTRIINEFRDNEFWLSVLRFFIQNPMLDPAHINPIVDYIWNQRYEPRVMFVDRGVAEELGPEQPNFSMRGRTVHSLLRAVEEWHRRLGKERKGGHLEWKKTDLQDFTFVEGSKESKNMKIWRIRELLNSQELVAEGRQMKHCVATYARSCHQGRCSIWTVDMETESGIEKLLTIEVQNGKEIRQIRGRRNRLPSAKEKEVIKRWSSKEGLTLAGYL